MLDKESAFIGGRVSVTLGVPLSHQESQLPFVVVGDLTVVEGSLVC
jgi:hypothetical protein